MKRGYPGLTLLFFLGAGIAGCESVGLIGRPTLGTEAGLEDVEVTAEVRGLDTRLREIHLRTHDGGAKSVKYTADTRVIMSGREYPVTTLRKGDSVALQLRQDSRGRDFVDLIRIRGRTDETIGPIHGGGSDTKTIEGRVERVEYRRGFFEVRGTSGTLVKVYLPYNPPQPAEERFHRIRVGDYVQVEGELVAEDRLELVAFLQDARR